MYYLTTVKEKRGNHANQEVEIISYIMISISGKMMTLKKKKRIKTNHLEKKIEKKKRSKPIWKKKKGGGGGNVCELVFISKPLRNKLNQMFGWKSSGRIGFANITRNATKGRGRD